MIRCLFCDSTNIELTVWYNPNNGEVGEVRPNQQQFCMDCDDYTMTYDSAKAAENVLEQRNG